MAKTTKIGIIICDRYRRCAGGKCFRAMQNREGAFSIYDKETNLEIVGYTTCDGCPGGNIEYAGDEMVANGVQVIHLATGLLVGYPPCPYIDTFKMFLENKYDVRVILGTHPIPQKYVEDHSKLGSWNSTEWQENIHMTWSDEKTRLAYN
jgi:predicted metal-binding protein